MLDHTYIDMRACLGHACRSASRSILERPMTASKAVCLVIDEALGIKLKNNVLCGVAFGNASETFCIAQCHSIDQIADPNRFHNL